MTGMPSCCGAAREAVGVVGDRRRLADEQRIVVGELGQVLPGDRLDLDAHLLGDARPVLERCRSSTAAVPRSGRSAWRRCSATASRALAARHSPLRVTLQPSRKRVLSARAEPPERRKADLADRRPFARLLMVTSSAGARNQSNRSRAKRSSALTAPMPKKIVTRPERRRPDPCGDLLSACSSSGKRVLVELALRQVDHRLDRGDDVVAARTRPAARHSSRGSDRHRCATG